MQDGGGIHASVKYHLGALEREKLVEARTDSITCSAAAERVFGQDGSQHSACRESAGLPSIPVSTNPSHWKRVCGRPSHV